MPAWWFCIICQETTGFQVILDNPAELPTKICCAEPPHLHCINSVFSLQAGLRGTEQPAVPPELSEFVWPPPGLLQLKSRSAPLPHTLRQHSRVCDVRLARANQSLRNGRQAPGPAVVGPGAAERPGPDNPRSPANKWRCRLRYRCRRPKSLYILSRHLMSVHGPRFPQVSPGCRQ